MPPFLCQGENEKVCYKGLKNHFYLLRLRNGGLGLFGVQLIHRGSICPLIVRRCAECCKYRNVFVSSVQARRDRLHFHTEEPRAKGC